MSIAFRKVIVCLTAAIALGAVGAIASASSASASCFKVVTAGTGTFEDSACTVADKTNEYIKISKLEKQLKAAKPGEPAEWCAKVETKETGTFEDAACTKAKAKGEFIKVFVHEYEVCQEGGTEKFSEHHCTPGTKEPSGKWSWLPIEAGKKFAIESTGGEFKLAGGGQESVCKHVTNTGEIEPGGQSKTTLVFTECTNGTGKCEAFAPAANDGKGTIEVSGITDQLVERGGKLADEFKENTATHEFVTIEFEVPGTEACAETPTTKVKGQVAGECKNITVAGQGETELVFPNPALVGNSLEAFGVKASLFGTATVSLVNKWSYRCA